MLITVRCRYIKLTADVREGELMGYKGPNIADINRDPQSCLAFMYELVKTLKEQKEMEEQK